MFGSGNWAIVGLAKESLDAFRTSLEDPAVMVAVSQMSASSVTRHFNSDALGFNPFSAPRLDEQHTLGLEHQQELARFATSDQDERSKLVLPAEILECDGYGVTVEQFQLHSTIPWYGLWAVSNEWKDISDLASVKEQRSYALLERPYKFLQAIDKRTVDQDTLGTTAAVRKQVPVLLDFSEGRIYIENSNKKLIYEITEKLKQLKVEIIAVAWTYSRSDWPAQILNKLYEDSQYLADFQKRAEEAKRFKRNEIEKLEDKELESIVSNYFSMTQLPSEVWVGISAPAQIRLHDANQPIGVRGPTNATTLLNMTEDAKVFSGSVTFQERITAVSKNRGAYTFRKDLFGIDLNDQINLTDVGAAMLRGFDIPAFRKDIQREIRQTKQVPSIEQFWSNWLHEMSNAVRTIEAAFREVLAIDGDEKAGVQPLQLAASEEEPELVNA